MGPEPRGSAGSPLPSGLALPNHVPCRVTRSSLTPGQAVCCVLGRPLWCQVEGTRGTHEVAYTSTATSTHLLTSSLWMGPGGVQGPPACPRSHPSAAHGGVAKLLCARCTGDAHSHTPPRTTGLLRAGSSKDMGLTRAGTPAGLSTQEPCTEPSLQSTRSLPVGQI